VAIPGGRLLPGCAGLAIVLLDAGLEPQVSIDPCFTIDIYSSYFRKQNVFPFEK
jgi:hypothetical protein